MKPLTLITALLITFSSFAQDSLTSKTPTNVRRILLGVNISADYCYRTLQNNDGSSISSMIIDSRNTYEEPKIGYTTGINICYNRFRKLGFEMGVQYSSKGYRYRRSDLRFGDRIDPNYGFVNPSQSPSPIELITTYNYTYLDIPLRAIYSLGERKIRFVTSIGISTNILLTATKTSVYEYANGDSEKHAENQEYEYNTVNISPTVSVGIDYKLCNNFNLRLEPTFRYGVLRIIDAPITEYLWSSGLNLTCYYSVK